MEDIPLVVVLLVVLWVVLLVVLLVILLVVVVFLVVEEGIVTILNSLLMVLGVVEGFGALVHSP